MTNKELARLLACNGWEGWMGNWIHTQELKFGLNEMTVYCCAHPDEYVFYVTSSPQEAVSAFSRPEFAYD